jgi:hypothetical protein
MSDPSKASFPQAEAATRNYRASGLSCHGGGATAQTCYFFPSAARAARASLQALDSCSRFSIMHCLIRPPPGMTPAQIVRTSPAQAVRTDTACADTG